MKRNRSLTFGVLLILFGAWFLAVQFFPSFGNWVEQFVDWPFWVMIPGLIFLVAAILSGVSGLVVPGMIISGIGGILYYQNITGDWQSWSYAWTTDAEMLFRARTAWLLLCLRYLVVVAATVAKQVETDELRELKKTNQSRQMTGKTRKRRV